MQLGSGLGLKINRKVRPPSPPQNDVTFDGEAMTQDGEVISFTGG